MLHDILENYEQNYAWLKIYRLYRKIEKLYNKSNLFRLVG